MLRIDHEKVPVKYSTLQVLRMLYLNVHFCRSQSEGKKGQNIKISICAEIAALDIQKSILTDFPPAGKQNRHNQLDFVSLSLSI